MTAETPKKAIKQALAGREGAYVKILSLISQTSRVHSQGPEEFDMLIMRYRIGNGFREMFIIEV